MYEASKFIFSTHFGILFGQSLKLYRKFFLPILGLAVLSYAPFFIIGLLMPELGEPLKIAHGMMLDIIIFLALPTIFMQNRIYVFPTMQIFQRFFTSGVLIVILQFVTLLFFLLLSMMISPIFSFLGMIPVIMICFAGHFLILHNRDQLIDFIPNLLESLLTVKANFMATFMIFIQTTLILMIPVMMASLVYIDSKTNFFSEISTEQDLKQTQTTQAEMIKAMKDDEGLKILTTVGHLLFRPIKSILLSLLFLGILFPNNATRVYAYLDYEEKEPKNPFESKAESEDSDTTTDIEE